MRLIDADELKAVYIPSGIEGFEKMMVPVEVVLQNIDDAPTVDAVPVRHGGWKEDPSGYGFWICSACEFVSEASAANLLYRYCPHCGADMRKDGDHAEGTIQKERS